MQRPKLTEAAWTDTREAEARVLWHVLTDTETRKALNAPYLSLL